MTFWNLFLRVLNVSSSFKASIISSLVSISHPPTILRMHMLFVTLNGIENIIEKSD